MPDGFSCSVLTFRRVGFAVESFPCIPLQLFIVRPQNKPLGESKKCKKHGEDLHSRQRTVRECETPETALLLKLKSRDNDVIWGNHKTGSWSKLDRSDYDLTTSGDDTAVHRIYIPKCFHVVQVIVLTLQESAGNHISNGPIHTRQYLYLYWQNRNIGRTPMTSSPS